MRKKTMMKIALQISIRHSSCQGKNNDGSFVSDLIWQMYFKLYHEETPSVHSWKRKIFVFLCSIYNNYQYSYVIKIQECRIRESKRHLWYYLILIISFERIFKQAYIQYYFLISTFLPTLKKAAARNSFAFTRLNLMDYTGNDYCRWTYKDVLN